MEKACVLHEHKKIAKGQVACKRKQASSPEGETNSSRSERHHNRQIDSRLKRIAKRIIKHFARKRLELSQVLFLADERFCRSHSCDSLIETGGDFRVRLTRRALRVNKPPLIYCRCNRQWWNDAQNDERQLPIHPEHHRRNRCQQKTTPHGIQQGPGKHRRYAVTVGCEPLHEPVERTLVIERTGTLVRKCG